MTFQTPVAALAPLAEWFEEHRRDLPWRAQDLDVPHPDPYAVLVSELMLQQTQVATVVPYFRRWMQRFPDPGHLVSAPDEEVHKLWEGLGYYRRARYLQEAAAAIVRKGWPQDLQGLRRLPGVGDYTAAALASIAFQCPEPALDGNAFRVLARFLGLLDDPRRHAGVLKEWLRPGLAALGPSRLTQAVMELGATHCAPAPDCARCPLRERCEARLQNLTAQIPPARPRTAARTMDLWLVAVQAEGGWLLLEPRTKGLLSGLWRWPSFESAPATMAAETPAAYGLLEARTWDGWTQTYSHRIERIQPVALHLEHRFPSPPGSLWVPRERLEELPLGKRDQRLRALLATPGVPPLVAVPAAAVLQGITGRKP